MIYRRPGAHRRRAAGGTRILLAATATATVTVAGVGGLGLARTASADETAAAGRAGIRADRPPAGHPAVGRVGGTGPSSIAPPRGHQVVARYRVLAGVQVYSCVNGAWAAQEPSALLVDGGSRELHHYGRRTGVDVVPVWAAADGSTVRGETVGVAPARRAHAIPALLLAGTGSGGGELGDVTYIQRLNTSGGLAPDRPCAEGRQLPVAYLADYVFWAARRR